MDVKRSRVLKRERQSRERRAKRGLDAPHVYQPMPVVLTEPQKQRRLENARLATAKAERARQRTQATSTRVPYVPTVAISSSSTHVARKEMVRGKLQFKLQFTQLCYDESEDRLYAVALSLSIWHIAADAAVLMFEFPHQHPLRMQIESLHVLPRGSPAHMVIRTTGGQFWTLTNGALSQLRIIDGVTQQSFDSLPNLHVRHVDTHARLVANVGGTVYRIGLQSASEATLERVVELGATVAVRCITTDAHKKMYVLDTRRRIFVADASFEAWTLMRDNGSLPALQHLSYSRYADRLLATDGYCICYAEIDVRNFAFDTTPICHWTHRADCASPILRHGRQLALLIALQRTESLRHWPPGLTAIVEAYTRPTSLIILAPDITTVTLLDAPKKPEPSTTRSV